MTTPWPSSPPLDWETVRALQALYDAHSDALDGGELERWPALYTEDCVYRLQSRENHERGLPLATLSFESRAMLEDRVHGVEETLFHDPYWQRHIVGAPQVLSVGDDGIRAQASYLVVRTKRDAMAELLSVGRYLDRVVSTAEGLRFAERLVIFDNDLIPNSLIHPI